MLASFVFEIRKVSTTWIAVAFVMIVCMRYFCGSDEHGEDDGHVGWIAARVLPVRQGEVAWQMCEL